MTQTRFLEREVTLLHWWFTPSILPCYDLYTSRTPRCKQSAGANRCCEIAIGLYFLTVPVHYNVQIHKPTFSIGLHCSCSLSNAPCALIFRVVEVEIQLRDRPRTGLPTKVVEEATPSLIPAFREGRAMSPVSAVRFSPQQVCISNSLRNFRHSQQGPISTLCLPLLLIL